MEIIRNFETDRQILRHLGDLYGIFDKREPNHLSTYVYCLTKAYWSHVTPIPPTDTECLLFALGYGLQDVITPTGATVPVYEKHGVIYRPDLELPEVWGDVPGEIKTTRLSPKTVETSGFPSTWMKYMKGVCFLKDISRYHLVVLHLMGYWRPPTPLVMSYDIEFSDEEIFDNWSELLSRKVVLDDALVNSQVPLPFTYMNADSGKAECNWGSGCRYRMLCDAQSLVLDIPNPNHAEEELGAID